MPKRRQTLAITLALLLIAPMLPAQQEEALSAARRLVDAGSFPDAERTLQAYLPSHPGSAPAHLLLAYTLLRLGNAAGALNEYTRSARLQAPTATDLRNVADAYVLLNDLPDAEKWMSISLQKDPTDANTWYGLGRIRFAQQRFDEAVQAFQRVLSLQPRSVKAENNLGLAYEGLNRTADAIAAYRQALAWQESAPPGSRPKDAEQPMLNLAIILIHEAKLPEALPLLQQAVQIAPRDPRIHEQLGHVYLQQNNLAAAQREFQTACGLSPENGSLHFLLGQVYRRQGLQQKAAAEFARSAELTNAHSSPDQ